MNMKTESEIPWVYFGDTRPEKGQMILCQDKYKGISFMVYDPDYHYHNTWQWVAVYFKPQEP